MSELFTKLGIDWKLLLAQAVNFLILLVALRITAYKPLLKLLEKRRRKIQEGIDKTNEADKRLGEVQEVTKGKIKKAEEEALGILKAVEARAKQEEARLVALAHKKEEGLLTEAKERIRAKEQEARVLIEKEAVALVKQAVLKVAELKSGAVDDALIHEAVRASAKKQHP